MFRLRRGLMFIPVIWLPVVLVGCGGGSSSGVAPTTTTLVSLENPANVGQAVTFAATVSSNNGIPVTGSVGFYTGTSKVGDAPLSNGVANFALTNDDASGASETITAEYDGTSNSFAPSTSAPVTQTWSTGTTIDVCPSDFGCATNYVWNNVDRAFEVFVPTALPPNPAIVIMLHGTQITTATGSNPLPVIQLDSGWSAVADYYGFILVKPASTYNSSSNQWNWNSYCMDGTALCDPYGSNGGAFPYAEGCGSADGECPDDIGFLGSLIKSLLTNQNSQYGNFTASPHMVYVTGFSSGAQMTERVGVELSNLVAAIAPASGPMYNVQGTNISLPLPLPGNVLAPISVQEWHGTEDEELPPCNGSALAGSNGTTNYSGVIFTLDTVDNTFNYWTGTTADNLTDQNAVFQTTATLCTTVTPENQIGSNYANDASTPPYPEPPNVPVMPSDLTGNIAVSTVPPPGGFRSAPITAASESSTAPGTTVTITSTSNPGVGGVAIITGMTPSQYNGTWIVTESTATSFQYTSTASGLADATGFGTATGGQNTEVQFIWEPGVEHSYEAQYNWARWLFFAAHPCPSCGSGNDQSKSNSKSNSNSKDKR
ncbi:MAG: hypothetical protein ACLQBK_22195 [Candidatus Sulfotelmatobacter sp.]